MHPQASRGFMVTVQPTSSRTPALSSGGSSVRNHRRSAKDPADRIIGATALVEGLTLITADRAIRRSRAVRTIW